ncbi:MAG: hypothetical protein GC149_18660 [Gammaproteobacteria bacterium]|nr:hypothetical protein [Gammaproteobacteria bacterium]
MIYKNRIIMLSKSQGLYYDGMIAVSGNTITNSGDIIQYQPPGAGAYNVTLSATFNPADHSITGTLNHFGGMQNVAFSLVYASGRAASKVSDIVNDTNHPAWTAPVFNATTDPLSISLSDNTAGAAAITTVSMMTSNIVFGNSNFTGTLTPVAGSLYEVSMPETGSPYGDVTLTGLAALRGNTLVLAASEPITTIAMFAEFQ